MALTGRSSCSQAHSQVFVVKVFAGVVQRAGIDANVAKVLMTLCKLFAVWGINQRLGDFLQVSMDTENWSISAR